MKKDWTIGLFTKEQEKGLVKFIKKTAKKNKDKGHYLVITPKQ